MVRRGSGVRVPFRASRAMNTPASVVIPTLGRPGQLAGCLDSLAACDPAPAEVIVVDQGAAADALEIARRVSGDQVTVVEDKGRGAARARNRGAKAARHDLVLFTDDDCRPAPEWLAAAAELHARYPDAILTGRVIAVGDPARVPSTRDDPQPQDHTGTRDCSVLFSNNMVVSRAALLSFGGFDERFPTAGGEDNDLCYRWLRSGRPLRYEPGLVVGHDDWRSPAQLEDLRLEYGRTQGMFYAKHLRAGDIRILEFIAHHALAAARGRLRARIYPLRAAGPHRRAPLAGQFVADVRARVTWVNPGESSAPASPRRAR